MDNNSIKKLPNLNTKEYWNVRYASGDWEKCEGRWQTNSFAKKQVKMLELSKSFTGTILDFGCGLGDAFPVYRDYFPSATLIGADHAEAAIVKCQKKFGNLAMFITGGVESIPDVDVIVASNVLEHLSDDKTITRMLVQKCSELYVFVPYMENPLCLEHINYYDKKSFLSFDIIDMKLFACRGWSQYGRQLWIDIYLKNILRPFLGKHIRCRKKQIMFRIKGNKDR